MAPVERTRWGGIVDPRLTASGFFRATRRDGVWWLVDPDGGRFLSKGVTTVRFDQDQIPNTSRRPYAEACGRKYGSEPAWRTAVATRLASWGFNSLGAWSEEAVATAGPVPLAFAPVLDLGSAYVAAQRPGAHAWLHGVFPDVFDPTFATFVQSAADALCRPRRDDPGIIGWFTDNELRWGSDWRRDDEQLVAFLGLPAGTPGRSAAIAMLQQRHRTAEAFDAVWRVGVRSWDDLAVAAGVGSPFVRPPMHVRNAAADRATGDDPRRTAFLADCDAFAGLLADRYFAATAAAVAAAAPNHMALGCRFAYVPQPTVLAAAGRHLDVIAFNCYDTDPRPVIAAYAATGRPSLIGEFSFRGDDAGLPNTHGAGPRVATQQARAARFERYVTAGLRTPELVGYHWFEHADQPAEGRFDGENSNYGTVTIDDEVYVELTRTMAALNARAEAIHAGEPHPTT